MLNNLFETWNAGFLADGGRNLAENTNQGVTGWYWSMSARGGHSKTEVIEDGFVLQNLLGIKANLTVIGLICTLINRELKNTYPVLYIRFQSI